jgi:hypothetical protein
MPNYSPTFSRPWQSEQIPFDNVSSLVVDYTSARRQKHGSHPTVDVWLMDDGGTYYQADVQPSLQFDDDDDLVAIEFSFGGPSTGFILLN